MRVLILGASGQVGNLLFNAHLEKGDQVIGTYYSKQTRPELIKLDITDPRSVKNLIVGQDPSVIYLPACLTNVDWCEDHPQISRNINVLGVRNVIMAIRRQSSLNQARLIYFSSDYVFDGIEGLYSEDAVPSPISVYGQQKLEAEHLVASQAKDYVILRTNVVFGPEPQGKNYVLQILEKMKDGKTVQGVTDEWSTPTYAPDLVKVALAANERRMIFHGVYHVAGSQPANRYKFARTVAEVFDLNPELVVPYPSVGMNRRAKRPHNGGLISEKLQDFPEILPRSYREGLLDLKKKIGG